MTPIFHNTKLNNKIMKKLTLDSIADYIKDESAQLIEQAKRLGRDHAENGQPNPTQDDLLMYVQTIRNAFLNLWHHIETQFLDKESITQMGNIEMSQQELMNKMRDDDYRSAKSELDEVNTQIHKIDDVINWKLLAVHGVTFAIMIIMESWLNSSFLQMLNGVTLEDAKYIGIFLYTLVFLAVLWFSNKIEKTISSSLRNIYRVLYFLVIGGFILFTSYLRTIYSQDGFDFLTFIGITAINTLVFMGLLKMKEYLPSMKQFNDMLQVNKLKKRRTIIEQKILQIKAEMKQQTVTNTDLVKNVQSQTATLEKNKRYLESQYFMAISAYCDTNRQLRSDRLSPNCFSQIPPLNLP